MAAQAASLPAKLAGARYINARNGHTRRRVINQVMLGLTGLMVLLALLPLVWIIAYVVYRGGQYLTPAFITQMPRPIGMDGGGVWHAIQGTLIITALATLFAVPPGLLAAIYVAYHPNTPIGAAVRFGTDVMAGVPSIVVGLFIYSLVVKPMGNYSGLAGAIATAILMLPTIIRTTEEMIKLVPNSLREASLGLGAAEWKTALSVTLPAAIDGIVTGVLLGVARASGETAPLLFTALGNDRFNAVNILQGGVARGQGFFAALWNVIDQPMDSLPLTLYKYASQPYPERINQSWAAAFVLMAVILALNIGARLWVSYRSSKLKG